MNQNANIGSMLPGAELKPTRDKAKEILTLRPTAQITGLIITDSADKTMCIVNKGEVRWYKINEFLPEKAQGDPNVHKCEEGTLP